MASIYSAASHLDSLASRIIEQPSSLYVGIGVAVFLCCMVAYEFDAMFSRS